MCAVMGGPVIEWGVIMGPCSPWLGWFMCILYKAPHCIPSAHTCSRLVPPPPHHCVVSPFWGLLILHSMTSNASQESYRKLCPV